MTDHVAELWALEQIRRLKHRYCRCLDTANLAELRELLTEDARFCYVGGSYRFEVEGRDAMVEAIATAFHAEAVAVHTVQHPEIDLISPTEASGLWYLRDWFMDLRARRITEGTAFYRDRYVLRDGRWLISVAEYSRIYEQVIPIEGTPTLTAHYLATHGRKLPPSQDPGH